MEENTGRKGAWRVGRREGRRGRKREGEREGVREDKDYREHFRDTEKGPSEIFALVLIGIYVRGNF